MVEVEVERDGDCRIIAADKLVVEGTNLWIYVGGKLTHIFDLTNYKLYGYCRKERRCKI